MYNCIHLTYVIFLISKLINFTASPSCLNRPSYSWNDFYLFIFVITSANLESRTTEGPGRAPKIKHIYISSTQTNSKYKQTKYIYNCLKNVKLSSSRSSLPYYHHQSCWRVRWKRFKKKRHNIGNSYNKLKLSFTVAIIKNKQVKIK